MVTAPPRRYASRVARTDDASLPGTERPKVLIRVVLRDRPGALGSVASRIGSIGADIHSVEVLEAGDGAAIDEFAVTLPRAADGSATDLVTLLVREIEEVDGVVVQQYRVVDEFPDLAASSLSIAAAVVAGSTTDEIQRGLLHGVARAFFTSYAEVRIDGLKVGSLGKDASSDAASFAVGTLEMICDRDREPLRDRERAQIATIVAIAASALGRLERLERLDGPASLDSLGSAGRPGE
jgi:hypothetical protein